MVKYHPTIDRWVHRNEQSRLPCLWASYGDGKWLNSSTSRWGGSSPWKTWWRSWRIEVYREKGSERWACHGWPWPSILKKSILTTFLIKFMVVLPSLGTPINCLIKVPITLPNALAIKTGRTILVTAQWSEPTIYRPAAAISHVNCRAVVDGMVKFNHGFD